MGLQHHFRAETIPGFVWSLPPHPLTHTHTHPSPTHTPQSCFSMCLLTGSQIPRPVLGLVRCKEIDPWSILLPIAIICSWRVVQARFQSNPFSSSQIQEVYLQVKRGRAPCELLLTPGLHSDITNTSMSPSCFCFVFHVNPQCTFVQMTERLPLGEQIAEEPLFTSLTSRGQAFCSNQPAVPT